MEKLNRREFMKFAGKSLIVGAGILIFPDYTLADISTKKELSEFSERDLLAKMIYGETRCCPTKEKVFAGITPFNRLETGLSYFGATSLKDVLLYKGAYNCFDNTEKNKKNLQKILYPDKEDKEWIESIIIAEGLLRNEWNGYNFNQTHFFKKNLIPKLKEGKLRIDPKKLKPIDSEEFKHQFYEEIII
jgi:hypothetical protein